MWRCSNWPGFWKPTGNVTFLKPWKAPSDGLIKGGIISNYVNWKVVFFVIAGASFTVSFVAIFVIPKEQPKRSIDALRTSYIDWIGAFLFTAGLLLLLISLSEGVSQGWKSSSTIAMLTISIIFLALFVFWQHHLEKMSHEPLMKVSTFKTARFSLAMLIVCIFSAGFTNFLVYSTYL